MAEACSNKQVKMQATNMKKDNKPMEGKMFTLKAQKQWATLKIYINIVLPRISTIKVTKKEEKEKKGNNRL